MDNGKTSNVIVDYAIGYVSGYTYLDLYSWYKYIEVITKVIIEDEIFPKDASYYFAGLSNITEIENLYNLNTSECTSMASMFALCANIKELDLSHFDTRNVTSMAYMFDKCVSLEEVNLSSFETSNVSNMGSLFNLCCNLKSLALNNFNTSNVTAMFSMFSGCYALQNLDLSGWDTSSVTSMSYMFDDCDELRVLDLSGLDVSNVTNMSSMFSDCSQLQVVDLSGWDTSNVTNMSSMFAWCIKLSNIDFSGFDLSKVTTIQNMFEYCYELKTINLSDFNTSIVTNMGGMFYQCRNLETIYVSDQWSTAAVTSSGGMFRDCNKLVGAISYNSSYTDASYANYTTGYLTYSSSEININASTVGFTTSDIVISVTWPLDATGLTKKISKDSGETWSEYTGEMTISENCTIQAKLVDAENVDVDMAILKINNIDKNEPIVTGGNAVTITQGLSKELSSYFTINANGTATVETEFIDLNNANKIVTNTNELWPGTHEIQCTVTKANGLTATATQTIIVNGNTEIGVYGNIYKVSDVEYHLVLNTTGALAEGYEESQIKYLGANIKSGRTYTRWSNGSFIKKVIIEEEINPVSTVAYFYDLGALNEIKNIENINTSNVTNMSNMFYSCSMIKQLDLSSWDTSNVTNMSGMFNYCKKLKTIYASESWSTASVTSSSSMFYYCTTLVGSIAYNSSYTDKTYANYTDGYLTYKAKE